MNLYLLLFLTILTLVTTGLPKRQQELYTADDTKPRPSDSQQTDPQVLSQIQNANSIDIHNEHFHEYSFLLDNKQDQQFVIAVDVDQTIKCRIVSYWQQDDMFIQSKKQEGEEIRVMVYEDSNRLIGTWGFYYTTGLSFNAKKQHEYLFKIFTKNRTKLLIMDLEHIIYKGSSDHIANASHIEPHERRTKQFKEKLSVLMRKIESNHIMNHWVGENVRLHIKRYMWYQVIESVVIFGFAMAQGYFIRKLLAKGYSIV